MNRVRGSRQTAARAEWAPNLGTHHDGAAPVDYIRANLPRFVRELQDLVRVPSISGDPRRAGDVKRCATTLAARLRQSGLRRVRILPTPRHPIVYGEWLEAPGAPTVLVYGHYDVQPVEPVADWKSPPFGAIIRSGFLHGRGASDDKGQLFCHLKAIEVLLKTQGRLPVNVKCLFEGEEEIGSPNLMPFLSRNRRALRADAAVMSDTRMLSDDQPALTYSLRGQLALEMEIHGPHHDLHSGQFGGVVHDPLQVLCEIVARLHDAHGRIAIPGFYDRVRRCNEAERDYLARTGPSDEEITRQAEITAAWGESGYSLYERLALRPSLSVTGLHGGHGGAGPKGVIPCRALVKLSFRLVADQNPDDIERLFRAFVGRIAPRTVRVMIRTHTRANPALINRRHPAMRAAAAAYRHVFRRTPVWIRSGGSIPVVSGFQRVLGIPTVLMGFASPQDGMHGPDERFNLRNFRRGILTSAAFLDQFSRLGLPSEVGKPPAPAQSPNGYDH